VPAEIRREEYERDGEQCTFVGDRGHRCEATRALEFDHVVPVARGGETTAKNLRLRCRAHNQYEADLAFGKAFMDGKRQTAKARTAKARVSRPEGVSARTAAGARRLAPEATEKQINAWLEVTPYLRALGCHADEALNASRCCLDMPDAPVDVRVHHSLAAHGRCCAHRIVHAPTAPC